MVVDLGRFAIWGSMVITSLEHTLLALLTEKELTSVSSKESCPGVMITPDLNFISSKITSDLCMAKEIAILQAEKIISLAAQLFK